MRGTQTVQGTESASITLDTNCDEEYWRGKWDQGFTGPYKPWEGSEEQLSALKGDT